MSAPVFLAEATDLTRYVSGSTYLLDGAEGRHAGVVQRRKIGEQIDVVDGAGARLRCEVQAVDTAELELLVTEQVHEPAPAPQIVLVQALAKGDRDEMAVEAATELGADRFIPWQAERSIVIWRGTRAAKSRARWVATVRSATKQARRSRIAEVEDALDSAALCTRVKAVCAAGGSALVLSEEATSPLASVHNAVTGSAGQILVIVGPEGGITARELTELSAAGAQAVRLGPHVLRTSTAGPVAIALLSQYLGRWT